MALYVCTSLFFAAIILLLVLKFAWGVDKGRLYHMLAVAQGADVYATAEEFRKAVEDEVVRITVDDIRERRVARDMDSDFARTIGGTGIEDTVLSGIRESDARMNSFNTVIRNFNQRLNTVEEEARSKGISEITATLETLEPDLAKRHLLEMYDNNEVNRIIMVLQGMQPRKRTDILNEMTTEDEIKKLADILKRIGDGEPYTNEVDRARNEMQNLDEE